MPAAPGRGGGGWGALVCGIIRLAAVAGRSRPAVPGGDCGALRGSAGPGPGAGGRARGCRRRPFGGRLPGGRGRGGRLLLRLFARAAAGGVAGHCGAPRGAGCSAAARSAAVWASVIGVLKRFGAGGGRGSWSSLAGACGAGRSVGYGGGYGCWLVRRERPGRGSAGAPSPPSSRLAGTCGRGRPRTQAVRAFGATERGHPARTLARGAVPAWRRGAASWVRGRLARTSSTPAHAGEGGATTVLPRQTPRRAQTCGLEARGPRPRLRRGCAFPGGAARVADARAGTPAVPGSPRLRRGGRDIRAPPWRPKPPSENAARVHTIR